MGGLRGSGAPIVPTSRASSGEAWPTTIGRLADQLRAPDARPGKQGRRAAIEETFLQIAAILLLATVVGAAFSRFRQPLIVSFIAAGIVMGGRVGAGHGYRQ